MRKKSTTLSPLTRPSTRSLSINKTQSQSDKYIFQSDDEVHTNKPVFEHKSNTPLSIKRSRGRSIKNSKFLQTPIRTSLSSSTVESDSGTEVSSTSKQSPGKYTYVKPVTRRDTRLISQTNTSIGDKDCEPKQREHNLKMLNTTIDNDHEQEKSKQQIETENIIPLPSIKRRYVKKKTLSTDTNPKTDIAECDDDNNNQKLSNIDEKDLMQFGSPQHQPQFQSQIEQKQQLQHQSDDEISNDSIEFVWSGSSKLSIEILKRRIPKEESRDHSIAQSDPTAQRKRAVIPRLTNFDALTGQSNETPSSKRTTNETIEQNAQKKSTSVITLNNVFQNDFVPSYTDAGAKMTTTTTTTTTGIPTIEEKPRPRIYAVKSTTMKARLQQQPPEIKRPKWMNDQQEKSEEEEDNLPPAGEEPDDFDYIPKGQYIPKRPNYRGRGTFTGRRTGMRGRPPGSRRQYHDDDDDDDYDQYEELNARYAARKQTGYRSSRPMYDMSGVDDDEDYDRNRRVSLTQAYRRNNTVRPPLSSMSGQRRIAINNGNHPIYKPYKSSSYRPTPATLGLSTSNRRTSSTSRSPTGTISKPYQHTSSTISKTYLDDDYYQHQTRPTTINNSTNSFVTKMNDTQLNDASNQSQIFFVNVPQQEQQKTQPQQVLSVLTTEQQQQQQQQVLPVTVVQQVKLPTEIPKQKKILPKPSATTNSQLNTSNENTSNTNNKPFAWSRPPARIQPSHNEQLINKNLHTTSINTDLDTMEAAHVLATAADVTMAADARRKAQQHDDDMTIMVEETPSNIAGEETIQCDENTVKALAQQQQQQQQLGTITANIIDENGIEHTVLLSTEEAQQLLSAQGAIIVDSDGQQIAIQQAQPQTFVTPFALDQAQLQALLAQAGIDPNTPLTIEQVDPNQQQQIATLCTSPGGTQYTVLTQGSAQTQFILQTTNEQPLTTLPVQSQPQPIAPKDELSSSPPTKRRAFAVKSTVRSETFDDSQEKPRRKIFATKSTVPSMNDEIHNNQEDFIGTRAYHRNTGRK